MPEPAGTGLSRRTFLSRSAGLALAVYGASKIPLSAFEDGIAAGGAGRQDPRLGLLRRRHRRAQRARPGRRPALRAAAAEPRPRARRPAPPFTEDPRLQLAPGGGGPGDPARRGQGQRLPGDRLRPPRPVALHLAPLLRDRRARRRLPHRLARPLPRLGRRRREPAAGALDGRLALADDRHRRQAGGGDRQRRRLRPLVAGRRPGRATRCTAASPASARCPRTRPALAQVARATAQTDKLRERPRRRSATSPARSPTPTPDFAHKLAGLAAYHRRRAADAGGDDPRRRRLRHPLRPGRRPRPQPARDLRRRCSPSSATSRRAASPTGS